MTQRKKVLGVIPARGGSKGLPRKNIKDLCGKPLVAYTISAALESDLFDEVVVSTDDPEIAEVSRRYGAEVPFLRPADISGDMASSDAVVDHALHYYLEQNIEFDDVCKLQPTSPLRTAKHLKESYFEFKEKKADYMVSVCKCEHTPLWSLTLDRDGYIDHFIQSRPKGARQELLEYYHLNGAIYWANVEKFLRDHTFLGDKFLAYIMDRDCSIDIDVKDDFILAEFYLSHNKKEDK